MHVAAVPWAHTFHVLLQSTTVDTRLMAGIYEPCCGHDHGVPAAPELPQVQAARPDTALLGTGIGLLRELEASSGDSIEARFIAGQCLYQHVADGAELDGCDTGCHDVDAHISQALRIFFSVARSVREESVFSDNERAKEMRNDELQLLLTEYYIGALKQMERTVSADQRCVAGCACQVMRAPTPACIAASTRPVPR